MDTLLPNWLAKRASLSPERIALIYRQREYSFLEVYNHSLEAAGKLQGAGVKKDDYIAVIFSNQAESVFLLYGLQMIGAKTVILNNRLTPRELEWQLKDSAASMLISESQFIDKVAETAKNLQISLLSRDDVFRLPSRQAAVQDEYRLSDVTTIMYTSGTTGNPKGVQQTYGNHWWSAVGSALNLGLNENDRWYCVVPIFHISGYSILMRSQIYGIGVVLEESFNEERAFEIIEAHHVTIMSVVTAMLQRMVGKQRGRQLPGFFRCMLLGGGPAPLSLLAECKELRLPVFQTFGMTETSSQFATLSPEDAFEKLGSSGKPLFPNEVKIVDGEEMLPPLKEGEILVKGPNVTPGYLGRDNAAAKSMEDGWFRTGDIGYLDQEGFLYVLDRRSDLIISGGENIYPAEIEGVLLSHPDILDAGVIGIRHKEWGQVPAAFIVISSERNRIEKEILQYCAAHLAKYKIPKQVAFVEQLPRNASKKLVRRVLREWAEKEWADEH